MQDSFLARLLRYAPRDGRVPEEDFLTEAFAAVLELDPQLVAAVFGTVAITRNRGPDRTFTLPASPRDITIETQFRVAEGRPDLVLSWNGLPQLIIENKIGATFTYAGDPPDASPTGGLLPASLMRDVPGLHQLQRYVNCVKRNDWPAKVVLISKWPRDDVPVAVAQSDTYLGNLLWHEIYEIFRRSQFRLDDRARILLAEFLKLMEAMNMTPPTPIRFGEGTTFHACFDLKSRMANLLERVISPMPKRFGIDVKKETRGDYYECWSLRSGDLLLYVGLLAGLREEPNCPIWPILQIHPNTSAAAVELAGKALEAEPSKIANWPGKVVFATTEDMSRFLGAWNWEGQVKELDAIVERWLGTLAKVGLLAHKDK